MSLSICINVSPSTLPLPYYEYVFAITEYFPFCFLHLPCCLSTEKSVHCSHVIRLLILTRQRGSMSQAVAPLQHYIANSPSQSFTQFYQLPHAASSPVISRLCPRISPSRKHIWIQPLTQARVHLVSLLIFFLL